MNTKWVNIFTLILSIVLLVICFWTYKKYTYSSIVENSFKNYVNISNVDNFVGKDIIIKAQIKEDLFFISKKTNHKVVLEYLLLEEKKNSRVRKINEGSFLKLLPFKVNFNKQDILVEPYNLDLTYIGNSVYKKENKKDNVTITEEYWQFRVKDNIYIFGRLENNQKNISLVNPNNNSSFFNKIFNPKPFIISNYQIKEIINKAQYTKNSMLSISILLLITSLFFIILSIKRILD